METCLAFIQRDHAWTDIGQPGPLGMYRDQVKPLKAAIESIRSATKSPRLISIKSYLEAE